MVLSGIERRHYGVKAGVWRGSFGLWPNNASRPGGRGRVPGKRE
jgi:hypothetical protein